MDRKQRVARLVDHAKNPRHSGVLADFDVAMPGGSPECGGSVVVYLKGEGDLIAGLSFTGDGDTMSMGATSMILEKTLSEDLAMEQVLALDYDEWVEGIGRDIVGNRTRNATLGLSTLKSAVRKYRGDRLRGERPEAEAV
ncbi:MAG: iron-sulfur cluster assembly scaffold protein [Rubrobacteraceae bacterium]